MKFVTFFQIHPTVGKFSDPLGNTVNSDFMNPSGFCDSVCVFMHHRNNRALLLLVDNKVFVL